jgi:hypothetical protein
MTRGGEDAVWCRRGSQRASSTTLAQSRRSPTVAAREPGDRVAAAATFWEGRFDGQDVSPFARLDVNAACAWLPN